MEDDVWKMLWKIKAPPKVLHFVWKALSGCLPTRTQLSSKHVPVELHCVLCSYGNESIFHVLVQCPFAHSCWLRSALGVGHHSTTNNFFDWFMEVLVVGNMGLVEEAVMVGWAIWKAQNDTLWNGRSCSAADVIWLARTTLRQWTSAQSKRLGSVSLAANHADTKDYWSKPAAGQLKINVDGAVFEDTNEIGTGFVARHCDGHVMEAFSTISSVSMPSIFGLFVKDCQIILSSLSNVFIGHVKRSANKATHCMTCGACYWSGLLCFESDISLAFQSSVLAHVSV
ncbi:uncharacterized protein LOC115715597 [Cannabis sativa]|uniref:uncharacterized protein LOC115715597 n=1 Tax=Cannabis sativa TaxID=3483 RepID=UPI0029C9BB5B|nr:uncharacterized protein LOC115715597 [Cannabis sativa]